MKKLICHPPLLKSHDYFFFRSLLFAALFAASTGVLVSAATFSRMSLDQLAQAAPVIVRARCVSNAVRWDRGEIWTFSTFTVAEIWKGSAAPTLTIRTLGGSIGNITSRVSGLPRFRPGEDVVLFLEPTAQAELAIVGWQQGAFRIRRDVRSGASLATQDAAYSVFDPAARQFAAYGLRDVAIEALRQRVAAAVASRTGRQR